MAADVPAKSGTEGGKTGYDVFREAVDAVKAGEDPNVAVYGEGGAPEVHFEEPGAYDIPEDSNSTLDQILEGEVSDNEGVEAEDATQAEVSDEEGETEGDDTPASDPDFEELVVSSNKGRKKVKIDWQSDKGKDAIRARLKRSYDYERGMRKFQSERDSAREEGQELRENWDALEAAYKEDGVRGLVNLIEGAPDAYQKYEEGLVERARIREDDPDRFAAIQAQEERERLLRALETQKEENKKVLDKVEADREAADLKALESRVNPAFDKYRFAGKLGSESDEHMFDQMLWRTTIDNLETYEDKGVEITPGIVEREFRKVSGAIRKRVGKQVERKVSKAVKKTKQKAKEHVQTAVKAGNEGNSAAREAHTLLQKQSGVSDILKNWSRYGKVFGSR